MVATCCNLACVLSFNACRQQTWISFRSLMSQGQTINSTAGKQNYDTVLGGRRFDRAPRSIVDSIIFGHDIDMSGGDRERPGFVKSWDRYRRQVCSMADLRSLAALAPPTFQRRGFSKGQICCSVLGEGSKRFAFFVRCLGEVRFK